MAQTREHLNRITGWAGGTFLPASCETCDHQCEEMENFKGCTDHEGSCINWQNEGMITTYSASIKHVMSSLIKED